MLIVRNSGAPPGNSVMGMNLSRNRLPTVTARATNMVMNLWRSVHMSSGVYMRCRNVSRSAGAPSSVSGKSPRRSSIAPNTGTAVTATAVDASSARLTDIANGLKNSPTKPCMNASGRNMATVVSVDDTIAALTSRVASNADWTRSPPCCMWR